jgi:hypothetical protein
VFSDQIVQAIRNAMASVVKESQDTVGHQKMALRELDELKWLSRFASQVRQAPYWTMAGWDASSRRDTSAKTPLAVKTGFATPYSLDALLGETVSGALLTVKATVSVATL